jgi:transposase
MTPARKRYPSDLTDLQWDNISNLFPPARRPPGQPGRKRTSPVREVVNAVMYLARGGWSRRIVPQDFPPWKTQDWDGAEEVVRRCGGRLHRVAKV